MAVRRFTERFLLKIEKQTKSMSRPFILKQHFGVTEELIDQKCSKYAFQMSVWVWTSHQIDMSGGMCVYFSSIPIQANPYELPFKPITNNTIQANWKFG